MNRAQRRSEVARFRRTSGGELLSYLFDANTPLDDGHLRAAVQFWQSHRAARRAVCIGCKCSLASQDAEIGAYLLATSPGSPGTASTSAFCGTCWTDLSDAEVEAAALRVLRQVLPNARFADVH